jgi:hypothetical protein
VHLVHQAAAAAGAPLKCTLSDATSQQYNLWYLTVFPGFPGFPGFPNDKRFRFLFQHHIDSTEKVKIPEIIL